ncbi:MAG: fructosamine kinase family protein [Bacteroidota bacterium]|nr:fructosamine kinase family protein [Bacteroidota bacterium]
MAESLKFYKHIIENHVGKDVAFFDLRSVGGGCINNAKKISTSKGDFFIKSNRDAKPDFFEKEAQGLSYLRKQKIISIPEVIGFGITDETPYILLEFINPGKTKSNYWEDFGSKLAEMHFVTQNNYGFETDNYIGGIEQSNLQNADWIQFFVQNRIIHQLDIAKKKKLVNVKLENQFVNLFEKLNDILVVDKPSLLHGDLWSGNVMTDSDGFVSLIDPAVYYGNREIEIAFTQLFGGFDAKFYQAYFSEFPVEKGYEKRADIYNIYPLLVHANLFGGSYIKSVESILQRFV